LLAYTFCDVMTLTLVYASSAYSLQTAQYIMAVIQHCLEAAAVEEEITFASVKAAVVEPVDHK